MHLLYSRAMEYRALRNYGNAEADLRSAIALNGENRFIAECELINVLAHRGDPGAKVEAQALLATMWDQHHAETTPTIKGELSALAAMIAYQMEDYASAAKLYGDALATRDDISWYILRSASSGKCPQTPRIASRCTRRVRQDAKPGTATRTLCRFV